MKIVVFFIFLRICFSSLIILKNRLNLFNCHFFRGISMNKAQLIEIIAKNHNLTKANAEAIVKSVFDAIKHKVQCGEEVSLVGFGTFSKVIRKARQARHPKSGKVLNIPQVEVPKFKPGRLFKIMVK